nr:unnamed protein product [Callosobruchus chinensis]
MEKPSWLGYNMKNVLLTNTNFCFEPTRLKPQEYWANIAVFIYVNLPDFYNGYDFRWKKPGEKNINPIINTKGHKRGWYVPTNEKLRGKTSESLLCQAANAVIQVGRKIKSVARELEICHMTLHRFVAKK